MSSKIKSVSNPKLKLEALSVEDIHRIHEATLTVIEKTGVRFPSSKALDIWEEHGATVDRERQVVKAPGTLIEKALGAEVHGSRN